jgi:hypothetical protein
MEQMLRHLIRLASIDTAYSWVYGKRVILNQLIYTKTRSARLNLKLETSKI